MVGYYGELEQASQRHHQNGWENPAIQDLRYRTLMHLLGVDEGTALIDLGCGSGELLRFLGPGYSGRYLGVDCRSAALRRARRELGDRFMEADLYDLEPDDVDEFEVAVAIGALVDGEPKIDERRREDARRLITSVCRLGREAGGVVLLNQDALDKDPVRSLEGALCGLRETELREIMPLMNREYLVEAVILPGELFVVVGGEQFEPKELSAECRERLVEESLGGPGDPFDRVRALMRLGRLTQANEVLEAMEQSAEVFFLQERLSFLKSNQGD